RARAIENLACCVGVNRVGRDGNGIDYAGDSAVLDATGEPVVELGSHAQVVTATLDPAHLEAHRERFPAWMDADRFRLGDDAG
ncbi:MAG: nitrilase-related carbon-nitrogen hydrolase, partial [Pseudoxanthomonas sp.]|nr:nitrilase-related carbon-nitrogen hydrolase [Pseudoxanthomonas sp.]